MKKIIPVILLTFTFLACKKQAPTGNAWFQPANTTEIHFTGQIDGVSWTNTGDSNGLGLFSEIDYDADLLKEGYFATYYTLGSQFQQTDFQVGFNGFEFPYSTYESAMFQSAMQTVPTTYYQYDSGTVGAEIIYTDLQDRRWSSGMGPQTNSSFNLTYNQPGPVLWGYPTRKVVGTASCKIYLTSDPTQSKSVTASFCGFIFGRQ